MSKSKKILMGISVIVYLYIIALTGILSQVAETAAWIALPYVLAAAGLFLLISLQILYDKYTRNENFQVSNDKLKKILERDTKLKERLKEKFGAE